MSTAAVLVPQRITPSLGTIIFTEIKSERSANLEIAESVQRIESFETAILLGLTEF